MSGMLEPGQPPPPLSMTQQDYTAHSGHGSVGPVIGVLAVIAILGALAIMVGRICSGRSIMGHGQYDFETWVETKFATCLDGRVDPIRPRVVLPPVAVPASGDVETGEERKEEEIAEHTHHHHHHQERNEA